MFNKIIKNILEELSTNSGLIITSYGLGISRVIIKNIKIYRYYYKFYKYIVKIKVLIN